MFQLNLLVLHVEPQLRAEYNFYLQPTANKGPLMEFLHFSCLFRVFIVRTSHIFWRKTRLFLKNIVSKYNKFVFLGQMSLRIIAELLKNAPVLLKYLE